MNERDYYTLSSGRKFYANFGILGLGPSGKITQGFDGDVSIRWDDRADEDDDGWFTTEEKVEIANQMIQRWRDWSLSSVQLKSTSTPSPTPPALPRSSAQDD